jgi:hypothetical protein
VTLHECREAVGRDVVWRHSPRGGYGYAYPVRVTIVSVGHSKVRVRAPLKSGGSKEILVVPRSIRPVGEAP